MRKIFSILIPIIIFSGSQLVQAQEQKTSFDKVGLGLSLFNFTEYSFEDNTLNSVYFTHDINNKLRIEPLIGFALSDGLSKYSLGIGAFGLKPLLDFNILYGLRIGIDNNKTVYIAPAIAGEYFFIDKFSIGSEIQLRGSNYTKDWTIMTNTSFICRFYF
jgi:hypothetical protein